jgi:hypothetical protein
LQIRSKKDEKYKHVKHLNKKLFCLQMPCPSCNTSLFTMAESSGRQQATICSLKEEIKELKKKVQSLQNNKNVYLKSVSEKKLIHSSNTTESCKLSISQGALQNHYFGVHKRFLGSLSTFPEVHLLPMSYGRS